MKTAPALILIAVATLSGALLLARPKTFAAEIFASRDSAAKDGSMEQQIVSKERQELDALKTGDLELFGNLTADDAVFVDEHGPASKAQILKNVAGFRITDYSMEDVRFVPISAKSGLISYKISEKGISHGKEFTAQVYVSSVWAERGSKWVCLFSQETPAK